MTQRQRSVRADWAAHRAALERHAREAAIAQRRREAAALRKRAAAAADAALPATPVSSRTERFLARRYTRYAVAHALPLTNSHSRSRSRSPSIPTLDEYLTHVTERVTHVLTRVVMTAVYLSAVALFFMALAYPPDAPLRAVTSPAAFTLIMLLVPLPALVPGALAGYAVAHLLAPLLTWPLHAAVKNNRAYRAWEASVAREERATTHRLHSLGITDV